jgi:uncharacterized membrane protein YfcA
MLTDLLLCAVGVIVGVMNAVAGGGFVIGFPVMVMAGLTPLVANATGNIVVLAGQAASAFGYRRFLRKVPLRYAWLLIPCALGSALGAVILRHTSGDQFEQLVPWLILFAVVLFAYQPFLQMHLHRHMHSKRKVAGSLIPLGIALLPMAIYGGFFGAGVGFIMLAFLGFTSLRDIHTINAMKNMASVVMTSITIIILLNGQFIDWPHGLSMAVGTTIGGYSGAQLAQKIPSHIIRIVVILIGLGAALYLGLHHY